MNRKFYKFLAWACAFGVMIYLPIMSYRGITIPLTDKAIIIGIMGIMAQLQSMEK